MRPLLALVLAAVMPPIITPSIAQTAAQPPQSSAHGNIHPPQEDWARLGIYAEDDRRLQAETPTTPRVVFLGDSITRRWGDPANSRMFQAHGNFIDRGINGNNTTQMLLRYRSDVLALKPQVVVLLGGTNDLVAFKLPDDVAFIEQNISSIVELAQANAEHIILCSVLPVSAAYRPQTSERRPEDILRLNGWLRDYASNKKIPYIDFYSALNDGHDRLQRSLTDDGLHPNRAGFARMEPLIAAAITHEMAAK